ncbi:glycosyltransferase family 2 protein [Bifidobacterium sp. 82T10]|uniref:Glycosyltransferase family 2 protein n=1 Tax=Bifidobacterium miconis TaxID=2834435 RepID=A0ABS6WHA1_9BIFI|nr:glycosyltransferase family 2 protein [Bifidobacterium miconis]MBW3093434.1 glycosyltransferase family 2 protein [Bifidobacterium miconis]
MDRKISVIIPTLNAGAQITELLASLQNQTRRPDEIIVVDSQSDDDTVQRVHRYEHVRLIEIQRKNFDHGATRDMALRESNGDYVLFLTQDALPKDSRYIEKLLKPFADEKVALVSGRQIARQSARLSEKLVREFNYPAKSHVRNANDIPQYGIKAFFATDVCSAYRRDAYLAVGGFEHPITTNEDMFIAAAFLHAGYSVAYAADAQVWHSHNFTLRQQYRRNYIMGREIELRKDKLGGAKVAGEGASLVRHVMGNLARTGQIGEMCWFCLDCAARLLGNRAGVRAAHKERS